VIIIKNISSYLYTALFFFLFSFFLLVTSRASAIVFEGRNRHTDEIVAIKIMTPDEDGDFNIHSIQSEIGFLKEFSSPFIVSYIESFHYENNIWVIVFSITILLLSL
jgi:serine/threonine protein kinase